MFVITIPVRNAENYIERALISALKQDHPNFRTIVIDDASNDSTIKNIEQTISKFNDTRVTFIKNNIRVGMLANHVLFAALCDNDDIIVNLDGDDELPHDKVLQRLEQEYNDPEVWMTYGSYEYDYESRNPNGSALGIARKVAPELHNRRHPWCSTHLRTYKKWLFSRIEDDDLRRGGEYIEHAIDLAFMFPLIEMSGAEHAHFIPDILYLYNGCNPENDHKAQDPAERDRAIRQSMNYILSQRIYPVLEKEKDYPAW